MNQTQKIKSYLLKGNSLTGLEALSMFGCWRLPARILNLKDTGVDVSDKWVDTDTGKRIKEYFIPRKEAMRILTNR